MGMATLEPVFAQFMVKTEWPYHCQGTKQVHISRAGIRTRADPRHGMPFRTDRTILLFLLSLVLIERRVEFQALDICKWFNTSWRRKEVIEKLYRVVCAEIGLPIADGWQQLVIAERLRIDHATGVVEIRFSQHFRDIAQAGISYEIEVARQVLERAAVLDLYLLCRYFLFEADYQREWDPYRILPGACRPSKDGQQLARRLGIIEEAWPANPFQLGTTHYRLSCAEETYHKCVFGMTRAEMDRTLESKLRGVAPKDLRQAIAKLPPYERKRAFQLYIEKNMLPKMQLDVGATLGSPPMNDQVQLVRVSVDKRRQVVAETLQAMVANGNQVLGESRPPEPAQPGQRTDMGAADDAGCIGTANGVLDETEQLSAGLAQVIELPRVSSEELREPRQCADEPSSAPSGVATEVDEEQPSEEPWEESGPSTGRSKMHGLTDRAGDVARRLPGMQTLQTLLDKLRWPKPTTAAERPSSIGTTQTAPSSGVGTTERESRSTRRAPGLSTGRVHIREAVRHVVKNVSGRIAIAWEPAVARSRRSAKRRGIVRWLRRARGSDDGPDR